MVITFLRKKDVGKIYIIFEGFAVILYGFSMPFLNDVSAYFDWYKYNTDQTVELNSTGGSLVQDGSIK